MPKSQYVDPGKVFEPGYIEFDPIPLCRYNKSLEEEKKNYSKADFLRIYHDMRTIREFETMLNEIKVKSEYNGVKYNNPGPAHLSIGQEASAVGQAYCLDINDFTFGSHRSHGEILAKGLSSINKLDETELYDIMKEFLGGNILRVVESRQSRATFASLQRTSFSTARLPKSSLVQQASTRVWADPCTRSSFPSVFSRTTLS